MRCSLVIRRLPRTSLCVLGMRNENHTHTHKWTIFLLLHRNEFTESARKFISVHYMCRINQKWTREEKLRQVNDLNIQAMRMSMYQVQERYTWEWERNWDDWMRLSRKISQYLCVCMCVCSMKKEEYRESKD